MTELHYCSIQAPFGETQHKGGCGPVRLPVGCKLDINWGNKNLEGRLTIFIHTCVPDRMEGESDSVTGGNFHSFGRLLCFLYTNFLDDTLCGLQPQSLATREFSGTYALGCWCDGLTWDVDGEKVHKNQKMLMKKIRMRSLIKQNKTLWDFTLFSGITSNMQRDIYICGEERDRCGIPFVLQFQKHIADKRMYGYEELGSIYNLDIHQVVSQGLEPSTQGWVKDYVLIRIRTEDVVWIEVFCLHWDWNKGCARSGENFGLNQDWNRGWARSGKLLVSTRIETEDGSCLGNFCLNQDWNGGLITAGKPFVSTRNGMEVRNNYKVLKKWQREIIMWRKKEGRSKVAREAETLRVGWMCGMVSLELWTAWHWPIRRLHSLQKKLIQLPAVDMQKVPRSFSLMHSDTVPKHLHMQTGGVWMTAWLEHAVCQLQLSKLFFAVIGGQNLANHRMLFKWQ
ncbi:hypothetical protein VP01_379g3 [Puccinia sorghi]|uniref:Uncharacterized protein n=1 Tax=Puccinia sorghi TaxID=27349 RepID=A0A0L6UTE5_9BASI|nr:hypothetical protein VP01_379g3 [Puccinia sorghi]